MTSEKTLSIYQKIEDIYTSLKEERDYLQRKSVSSYLTRPERASYMFIGNLMDKTKRVLEELES